jgi:hypothetical protein
MLVVLTVALAACNTGGGPSASCQGDAACPQGTVCVQGACGIVKCTTSGDCASTQICSARVCMAAECDCLECQPCPVGETCQVGKCQAEACTGADCDSLCVTKDDCEDDQICDGGSCRPCEGDECGTPATCVDTGCEEGKTCNQTTGLCEEPANTEPAEACGTCQSATDCPKGWQCVGLSSGKGCLKPCQAPDDCATGWTCWGGACTPAGFACKGCAVKPCEAGKTCDTAVSYECAEPTALCSACSYDWECGPDAACHSLSVGDRRCVPRCSEGACPSGSTCTTDPGSRFEVCAPSSAGSCCFEADPADCTSACGTCPAGKPQCKGTICVACLVDTDCAQGICDAILNVCKAEGPQCPTGKVFNPTVGGCTQCAVDSDCAAFGGTCDANGNCTQGGVCATCAAPYPACVKVDADYYCVQCAADADCGLGGTCNPETYACSGGTVTPTEKCELDTDCTNSGSYVLACDPASGYCYDQTGQCDEVSAFCANGGTCYFSELSAMLSQLGAGVPFGGQCQCDPAGPPCPSGLDCVDAGFLDAKAGYLCSNTCKANDAWLWKLLGGTCP